MIEEAKPEGPEPEATPVAVEAVTPHVEPVEAVTEVQVVEAKVADAFGTLVTEAKAATAKAAPRASGLLARARATGVTTLIRLRAAGIQGVAGLRGAVRPILSGAGSAWAGMSVSTSRIVVTALAVGGLAYYTYRLGEEAVHARAEAVAAQAVARKVEQDDGVVQAALAEANRRSDADAAEIGRLNGVIAASHATRTCPTAVYDTIHSLGRRR